MGFVIIVKRHNEARANYSHETCGFELLTVVMADGRIKVRH